MVFLTVEKIYGSKKEPGWSKIKTGHICLVWISVNLRKDNFLPLPQEGNCRAEAKHVYVKLYQLNIVYSRENEFQPIGK